MKNFDYLPETIRRACEVAETAGFTFVLVDLTERAFYKGMTEWYSEAMLAPQLNVMQHIQRERPGISCLDSGGREPIKTVEERINQAKPYVRTSINLMKEVKKHDATFALFKKAYRNFHFSFIEAQNCLKLSEAIRALAGPASIQSHHMAEAIQYACPRI
jgi:hypothetical protein